jgi:hypothetical protein
MTLKNSAISGLQVIKNKMTDFSEKSALVTFWSATILFVLVSKPFLKLPYDMWHHLMLIRGWHTNGSPILTMPGTTYHEVGWHWLWAQVFKILQIDSVFAWAKIIHCTQFLWLLFCLSFFATTFFRCAFPTLARTRARLLGLYSAWLFVVGTGTFSGSFQQAWILWYSVNYQGFTLPAFWLGLGIFLRLIISAEVLSAKARTAHFFAVVALLGSIAVLHPLEGAYLVLLSGLFCIVTPVATFRFIKASPLLGWGSVGVVVSLPFLVELLGTFGWALPRPSAMPILKDFLALRNHINVAGAAVVGSGLHRGTSTFTELAVSSTACGAFSLFSLIKRSPRNQLNKHLCRPTVLLFGILAALLMWAAPRLHWSAGVLSALTDTQLAYRFSYAAPWFLGFGALACIVWHTTHLKSQLTFWLVALSPALVALLVSRLFLHGPANANIASVFRMLELRKKDSVDIQYPRHLLLLLNNQVAAAPKPPPGKDNIFLVRADLIPYLRAATGAYVLGDRFSPASEATFNGLADRFQLITVSVPNELMVDEVLSRTFPMIAPSIQP